MNIEELIHDLRARINTQYYDQLGTESYERHQVVKAVEYLRQENERLRVQLAGCGVAAMQNTADSRKDRIEKGAYGWSASYADVCSAVDREIALREENERLCTVERAAEWYVNNADSPKSALNHIKAALDAARGV